MKPRLAAAAAKRLDEHRTLQTGPLAAAQKMLWEALLAGNIEEALKQADIVERIRGPQPPSPLALKLIDRFNRMAAENARFKALEQQSEADAVKVYPIYRGPSEDNPRREGLSNPSQVRADER
jgi:hypothetical protein